jgi:hypothetical protein
MIEIKITGENVKDIKEQIEAFAFELDGGLCVDAPSAEGLRAAMGFESKKVAEAIQPAPGAEEAKPKTKARKTAPKPEPEGSISLNDVKLLTANAIRAGHREEVQELLSSHNAETVSQLSPEVYEEYVNALERLDR